MKKIYVTYEEIHKLVKKIADKIKNDNWEPDCIVAIASGGFIPSRIMKTYLRKDVYVVGLKRYTDDEVIHQTPVKIQWIDEVEKKLKNKKILLVDEVDDTRVTLEYCLNELYKNNPDEVRVAVLHQKKKEKAGKFPNKLKIIYEGGIVEDHWIAYPWESSDIEKHNQNAAQ